MAGNDSIQFSYLVDRFYFPQRTVVKQFIRRLIKAENKQLNHISFVFCTDDYLLEVNQTYLHHGTLTDIITFELSEVGDPLLSDIFISIDRIKENAHQVGVPVLHELLRVMFHGVLHLCGYKDKSPADKTLMTKKEDYYLSLFLVSRGTLR
jgi:probable rRNA maturation factor